MQLISLEKEMKKTFGFALSMALAATSISFGQQPTEQPAGQFTQNAVVIQAEDNGDGAPKMQYMSMSSDGGSFFSTGEFAMSLAPGMGADPFQMLSNPGVQNELDLVGKQLDQYKELQTSYGKRISAELEKMKSGKPSQDGARSLEKTIKEIEEQKKEDIEKLLLPSQRERLEQISLQQKMKNQGTAAALANDEIREKLGLSEKDVEKLKGKAKELNEKMQEKMQKLRAEMRAELLDELSSEQKAKLKELTGDDFEFKVEMPGFRMRGGSSQSSKSSDSSSSSAGSSDSSSSSSNSSDSGSSVKRKKN
jgi:hypothetical protein